MSFFEHIAQAVLRLTRKKKMIRFDYKKTPTHQSLDCGTIVLGLNGDKMTTDQQQEEVSMLRTEIEMLMGERASLLRTVGAAAVFVAHMDSSTLAEDTYTSADVLAHALNALPEESLHDALEMIRPEMDPTSGESIDGRVGQ
jgi:hypothetical protein